MNSSAVVQSRVPPVFLAPSDLCAQAESSLTNLAGSSSEVNIKLLKSLIKTVASLAEMKTPEEVHKLLAGHNQDTNTAAFTSCELNVSLKPSAANECAQDSGDVDKIIASQHLRVKEDAEAIDDYQSKIAAGRIKTNYSLSLLTANKEATLQMLAGTDDSNVDKITVHTSFSVLWGKATAAIANMKSGYVDFYADLMQKYTEMYADYNNDIQKAAAEAVSAGSDGNNVHFDQGKMSAGYDAFDEKYKNVVQGNVKNWDKMTDAEKESMKTTLAPAFTVSDKGEVRFDLSQYSTKSAFPNVNKDGEASTASYQAWLAGFNAVGTGLQSNMQSFFQRYSQANNTFDNNNKFLSGLISSTGQLLNDIIKNFC